MVNRVVRLYVEGGSTGRIADRDFRRGWKKFLMRLHERARECGYHSLEIVRGKGRSNTFARFERHQENYPEDLGALLVDSEDVVGASRGVWEVVAKREADQWIKPSWASESQLYLMVQFVETWIVTDVEALAAYFGAGFRREVLPSTNLEKRSKDEIDQALCKATKGSRKGVYRHGQAHEIIEFVRPERVQTLRHGMRLFDDLSTLIQRNARD